MNIYSKTQKTFMKLNALLQFSRNISITRTLNLKEILTREEGNNITISAKLVESARKPFLVQHETSHSCPLCATNLDVKHTDVLILSQFVRSDGCMMPRRITGLCKKQQRRVSSLVAMAQKAGLMPNLAPASSKKDPTKRYQWEKYNKYFDETTIKFK